MTDAQPQKTTKTAWKAAKRHTVTLPSGTEVDIVLPNLPALIKGGQIPNELIDIAIGQATSQDDVTAEQIKEQADFFNFLVSITVVEPKVTEEEVTELPYEDVEMLVEFATRQRDIDALYRHIGGLDKSSDFRRFRRLSAEHALAAGS